MLAGFIVLAQPSLYSRSSNLLLQMKTIHHLMLDLHLGFVQTRWTFTNADESYLTKVASTSCLHLVEYQFKCVMHGVAQCCL